MHSQRQRSLFHNLFLSCGRGHTYIRCCYVTGSTVSNWSLDLPDPWKVSSKAIPMNLHFQFLDDLSHVVMVSCLSRRLSAWLMNVLPLQSPLLRCVALSHEFFCLRSSTAPNASLSSLLRQYHRRTAFLSSTQ